ncbi:MAG: Transcriptional regulator, MarR family [uncultured Paraburkholderia sp.]|nr:MAG: Transcriptional regulator, MarR family [uncultured Paraburkholderia sp.]CAH2940891.1 MAG: Transcriptional regulator, MarR family [uncultured Paraburkholderia sp.]
MRLLDQLYHVHSRTDAPRRRPRRPPRENRRPHGRRPRRHHEDGRRTGVTLRAQALKGVSRSDLEATLRVLAAFTADSSVRADSASDDSGPT